MKKIILVALAIVSFAAANAQSKKEAKNFTFAVGPVLSFPSGDFSLSHSVGFGAEVELLTPIASNFEAFAQAGYSSFTGKTVSGYKFSSIGFVPVLIGARYSNQFVVGLGLGYGSFSGGGNSASGFTFSPQAGYDFGKVEVLANYTSVGTSGGATNFFGFKGFIKF